MNTSLKLDKKYKKDGGKHPLYVRIRKKNSKGKFEETSIYTDVDLEPKHFKNGGIVPKSPNYTNYNRMVNSIMDDITNIISSLKEDDLEPNPKLVKKMYGEGLVVKEMKTPQITSFWNGFEEYLTTKRDKSYGYLKTIKTLKNVLKEFEDNRKIKLTYEYIIYKTPLFQSDFNNFCWNVKKHSNEYVNKFYDNLSGFLYYSVQMRYIPSKPKFQLLKPYDKDELVYLRTNEIVKLFNHKEWDYDENRVDELLKNPHITIIEEELLGTNSKKFGGVLKLTNWELVKYIFLFMNQIGCRMGDIEHFKVSDLRLQTERERENQILSWVQQKTKNRVSVPLNDIGGFIYRKFSSGKKRTQSLFPKISNQKFNKQLKNLLKELGGFDREVRNPKYRGTKTVNDDWKPLWSMVSSHCSRRGFVKNSIELGTMDYRTIMKLGGWKTFSEFSKYISVTHKDIMKIRELNPLTKVSKKDLRTKLLSNFDKLTTEQQKSIIFTTEQYLK